MWLTKWFTELKHNKKKRNFLSKLKPNDRIIINCPKGFDMIINSELRYSDYPCYSEIISNDAEDEKLWIRFDFKKDKILKVLDYSSKELRNYLLFNIYSANFKSTPEKKNLSKEELEQA